MTMGPQHEVRIPERPTPGAPKPEETTLTVDQTKVQPMRVENPGMTVRRSPVALLCAQCGAQMTRDPATVPFGSGPWKGGFLCKECWVLHWDEHPELLADAESRRWVSQEARSIRLKRVGGGAELLFEEGPHRAYLTERGTVIVDIARLPFGGPDEYDPDRFATLLRVAQALRDKKVPGYEGPGTS